MTRRTLRWHRLDRFVLESGQVLRDIRQAYHLDGRLNRRRDNLVVVFHALTGSADAAGGWWKDVIGPGRALDTDRWAVLAPNLLGSCYGTTYRLDDRGAGNPEGTSGFATANPTAPESPPVRDRPVITTRDMARLIRELVRELGVRSVALATGGSLGGMVALEWAAGFPELSRAVVAFAAPAAHTAGAIGWSHVQRRAIAAAGSAGLELARMAAMLSYRNPDGLHARFGRDTADDGRFQVASWLDHHGAALRDRFDTDAYLNLLDAMDAHDVGRGRGGTGPALQAFRGRLVGVGIPGDVLYTDEDVRAWTDAAGADYRAITSPHGHDAFLIETGQVATILREALASTSHQHDAGEAGRAGRRACAAG